MDNRTIDVVSEGDRGIGLALDLVWRNAVGAKATHYKLMKLSKSKIAWEGSVEGADGCQSLVLLWHEERGSIPLPYPLDLDGATTFVTGWLNAVDYGKMPDHDGSNDKGWRIFTDAWGHVADHRYAIVGVQPAWAMHGK